MKKQAMFSYESKGKRDSIFFCKHSLATTLFGLGERSPEIGSLDCNTILQMELLYKNRV